MAVAVNDCARVGGDSDALATNGDRVEGGRIGEAKGGKSVECHCCSCLEPREVDRGAILSGNIGQDNVGTRCNGGSDLRVVRAYAWCA